MEERSRMERGEIPDPTHTGWSLSTGNIEVKRSMSIRRADEWGNNKVPYFWVAPEGPMQWNGQDVSHWMPLPEYPKEGIENYLSTCHLIDITTSQDIESGRYPIYAIGVDFSEDDLTDDERTLLEQSKQWREE